MASAADEPNWREVSASFPPRIPMSFIYLPATSRAPLFTLPIAVSFPSEGISSVISLISPFSSITSVTVSRETPLLRIASIADWR